MGKQRIKPNYHFDGIHFHAGFGLSQAAVSSAKNLAKERILIGGALICAGGVIISVSG